VRSQPIAQEPRRHGEVDAILIEALKLDPPKPAGKYVFAKFRT
jgi:hypothetical protein